MGLIGRRLARHADRIQRRADRIAIALWLHPGPLARLAAGNAGREVFESPIAAKKLHFIAFCVLGLVFAIDALRGLVSILLRIAVSARVGDIAFPTLAWQNGADLFVLFLKLALGIGLSLGARGLVGLLHRLRERALPPPRYDVEPEECRRRRNDPGVRRRTKVHRLPVQ